MFTTTILRISRFYGKACYEFAHNSVKATINYEINEAISQKLDKMKDCDFYKIQRKDGKIDCIVMNSFAINELSLSLTNHIQDYLISSNVNFGIPFGNVTGFKILSGIGPKIKTRVVTIGNVTTEISSDLKEAGINQTLYRVMLHYKTELVNMAPFKESPITIDGSVTLCEILLVGDIPNLIVSPFE